MMDLLKNMKSIVNNSQNFIESKNFYYENHKCEKTGNNKNIKLDYILSCETTDKILRFGMCDECKTCFYHNDYNSKTF